MQPSTTTPTTTLSTFTRLLIAFVLGLPTGILSYFTLQASSIEWWQFGIPIVVLTAAMLLSILLDTGVHEGAVSPLRAAISIIVVLLLTGVFIATSTFLPPLNQNFTFLVIALVPFSTGLAATFAVGSAGTWWSALGTSLVAWLGTGIPTIIVAVIKYIAYEQQNPGGDGGLVLPFTIVGVLLGFILAALGGIVGKVLRSWLLGE
jgi:hypothetical protein